MATPKKSGSKKSSSKSGAKKGSNAGLIFPVGRVGSRLRKGRYAKRVGALSGVYLAAVLEYLTAELLDLSAGAAGYKTRSNTQGSKKSKLPRISPRHVTLAVRSDDDLGGLLRDVTVARGGVVPDVNKALEKKKKSKSKKTKA